MKSELLKFNLSISENTHGGRTEQQQKRRKIEKGVNDNLKDNFGYEGRAKGNMEGCLIIGFSTKETSILQLFISLFRSTFEK